MGTFDVAATAHTTVGGCTCLMSWRAADGAPLNNGCANPNNDTAGAWCPIQPGSCTQPSQARGKLRAPGFKGQRDGFACGSDLLARAK